MFQRKWLTVERDDYVFEVGSGVDELCLLLLAKGEAPFLSFGLPLYFWYYSIHDDKEGRIGFAPHAISAKRAPLWSTVPSRELGNAKD
mmetsp:Transcript_22314/g.27386  ORF Transcript_22314/g.27386 Transcript_22314/m.27386 type:complete len:88 (-) Transcript_22314:331-594(-)